MIVVRFFCICGAGPFDVDDQDHLEDLLPPCRIAEMGGKEDNLVFCPRCSEPFPDFLQVGRKVPA